jgi:hypothetical protein
LDNYCPAAFLRQNLAESRNSLWSRQLPSHDVSARRPLVVRREFHAKLAVLNIGDVFNTGPTEAAYVINELVKPNAVIASHANEAATKDGKLLPNTKTATFKAAVHVPTYLPLSGKTMSFDTEGKCTGGC